MNIHFEVDM